MYILFGVVVIHGNVTIIEVFPEVLSLIDAVSKSLSKFAVFVDLLIFDFYSCEIIANLWFQMKRRFGSTQKSKEENDNDNKR